MPMIDIPKSFKTDPCGIEESLAMIINAIAFEEVNLAEFIDTQSKEIKTISEMFCSDNFDIEFVIDINQSINNTLEKVIQLHILQQLVLEAIFKIFSSAHPSIIPMPDSLSIHTLKGRGVGTVQDKSDYFYGGISIIQGFVCSKSQNGIHNSLCYSVHNSTSMEIMIVFPESLKMKCCLLNNTKKVEIIGEGKIIRKERFQPDVFDTGTFMLSIVYDGYETDNCTFEMTLKSKGNASFDHYSGKTEVASGQLEMEPLICMNLFKLFKSSSVDNDTCNENQQNSLLISIALKQLESTNAIYTETEKIKSALRNLNEHTENDLTTLVGINNNAEEALSRIIMEKLPLQAELYKLLK